MKLRLAVSTLALLAAGAGIVSTAPQRPIPSAQQRPSRLTDAQVSVLLQRTVRDADAFRRNVDLSVSRTPLPQERAEDNISRFVLELNDTAAHLRDHADRRIVVPNDVDDLLVSAGRVDTFMARHRLSAAATSSWTAVRRDLDEVAQAYNVDWNWNQPRTVPVQESSPLYRQLSGTFELDRARSDNAVRAAETATQTLPAAQRDRALQNLSTRLEPPQVIAIDRNGDSVTIASSRAQRVTFQADGEQRSEVGPAGRNITTRATVYGDQLMVSTTGNRGSDFTVTFEPLDAGRTLLVTRRVSSDALTQPVTARSYYRETSPQPRWDLSTTGESNSYLVPDGTRFVAVLDTPIASRTVRQGQHFTATVRGGAYDGAVIDGVIASVNPTPRAGERTDMNLDFQSIRMRNGRTSAFSGTLDAVRTPDGRSIGVDAEPVNANQTDTAIQRGAIGAAVGAIIGAIAGGGKGAAIGAVVGGGAGAGTVYLDGRGDLDLPPGSELTIISRQ